LVAGGIAGAAAAARSDDDDDVDELFDSNRRSPRGAAASPEIFSESASDLCLAFDPQVGFALVGLHNPRGGQPRLRAYDMYNKRVAWESLAGQAGLKDVDEERLAVRGRNVYVSLGRSLSVLDLFTGQPKWGAEFTDRLAYDSSYHARRGLRIVDPVPPAHRGAVLTFSVDYTISAFDRESGQPLWREVRQHLPSDDYPIEEAGLVVLNRPLEVMNPFVQKPLVTIEQSLERLDVVGRYGLWQVRHYGWRDRAGIVVHDFVTNKEVLFEGVDHLEDDVPTVMGSGKVFAATESGAKLFGGPKPKTVELVPGFHIRSLVMGGPTLFALLEKTHGTDYRRVVGVDPETLALRFDLGELTTEPDDDWTQQMCTNGQITVLVTSPTNDDDNCELWGVDPGGRVHWKANVGEWRGHYFLGGHLVVCSVGTWRILRPDSGQEVAVYSDR
jgi:outer membrane protein assembly factor BamB